MRQYWEFQSYIPSVFGQIINFFVSILIDFGLEIVLRLHWRALPLKHSFWWGKVEMTLTAFLYRRCSETHRAVERSEQAAALRSILVAKNGPETRSETVRRATVHDRHQV